jgi:aldose 1-epimerase
LVAALVLWCVGVGTRVQADTRISKRAFGALPDGSEADLYTLKSANLEVRITNYGGRIVSIWAPDRRGRRDDVVLGFDAPGQYAAAKPFFGALLGRYANRIAGGQFTLDGHTWHTTQNAGQNTLHGGLRGFDKRLWEAHPEGSDLVLRYVSPDGEEGFPGTLTALVRYRLVGDELRIHYQATTDQDTVVNLSNHSYFNLAGAANGDVLDHRLTLFADRYTPSDSAGIPTGELLSVAATPFDFRRSRRIGERIDAAELHATRGYDQNWVLNPPPNGRAAPRLVAIAREPRSGRVLEVLTTEPGVQFYTANSFDGTLVGKAGKRYPLHGGFCLETQHFPNSPNEPDFPTTVLRAGQRFDSTTVFRFNVSAGATR